MQKDTKIYTHEEIGVPHTLNLVGREIEVILDPTIVKFTPKENKDNSKFFIDQYDHTGALGIAQYKENKIYLFPGNGEIAPTLEGIRLVLLQEITHWVYYILTVQQFSGWLHKDEHLVQLSAELWYQVFKQLNFS